MSEKETLDMNKAFARKGAKKRFRKLIGLKVIADEEVDEMIANNDGSHLLECLESVRQPVYEVTWGALWHGASGRFEMYHFDGNYFTRNDYSNEVRGPFKRAIEAAKASAGLFEMHHEPGCGFEQAMHYSSELHESGDKLISPRTEEQIFHTITGQSAVAGGFNWCEVEPGKLFHDLYHDETGKLVKEIYDAHRNGSFQAISKAEANFAKATKKTRITDYALGEQAAFFTSAYDSFLMKVPLYAKKSLECYRTDWVRLCLPRRLGGKTVVKVIPVKNLHLEVPKLKPVALNEPQVDAQANQ